MDISKTESGLPDLLCGPIAAVEKVKMNAPSELNIAIVRHNKAAKQPAALLKLQLGPMLRRR